MSRRESKHKRNNTPRIVRIKGELVNLETGQVLGPGKRKK
jgi:hypothetical protein